MADSLKVHVPCQEKKGKPGMLRASFGQYFGGILTAEVATAGAPCICTFVINATKFLTEFEFQSTGVMCIMGTQNRDRNSTHDRKQ